MIGSWLCRVGWHRRRYQVIERDEVNTRARCSRCGFVGLVDSQGNLF